MVQFVTYPHKQSLFLFFLLFLYNNKQTNKLSDKKYYRQTYHDGVYLSSLSDRPTSSSSSTNKKNIKLFPSKKKSYRVPPPQCSEAYNITYHHGHSY